MEQFSDGGKGWVLSCSSGVPQALPEETCSHF